MAERPPDTREQTPVEAPAGPAGQDATASAPGPQGSDPASGGRAGRRRTVAALIVGVVLTLVFAFSFIGAFRLGLLADVLVGPIFGALLTAAVACGYDASARKGAPYRGICTHAG